MLRIFFSSLGKIDKLFTEITLNFQNSNITTAKELLPDDALIQIFNKKIRIDQTERIYVPARTAANGRNPIIIIGDIESDINIIKRIQEICKIMNKKNLFDPKFYKDFKVDITFVILGDIVGNFGQCGWNKYIWAIYFSRNSSSIKCLSSERMSRRTIFQNKIRGSEK